MRCQRDLEELYDGVLMAVVIPVFTMPFPLAFDGRLQGQVLRVFTDTVAAWYRSLRCGIVAERFGNGV